MNVASTVPQAAFDADFRGPPAAVPEESLGLRSALALAWQGRWAIAAGAVVGLALAGLHIATSAPRYTAVATVLYDPGARTVGLAQAAPRRSSDDLRNQIEILRSTSLIDRVVADLDLAGVAGPDPVRNAVPATGEEPRALDWNAWFRRNWGGGVEAAEQPAAPRTRATNAGAAAERAAVRAARDRVRDGLTLLPLPASSVIEISYTAEEPALSARIVNSVAKQYITAQLDATLSSAREATAWLAARVEELRRDVEAAEAAVASYETQVAEATGRSAAAMKREIEELSRSLAEASARRSAANIRYQRAASEVEDPGRIAAIADFQTSELMRSYRAQEADLSSDRAALGKLVPEGHERLDAIDGRITHVRGAIRAEAERITEALANELEIARASQAALETELRGLREEIRSQERKEVRLRQLESEAAASRLIYESFLRRLKETTQRAKIEHGDAVILSPAEAPTVPDSANTNRTLAAGLIFGGMFGFGGVLLFSQLNTTVRGIEQAQQLTGLTVMGTIPTVGRRRRRRQVLQHALDRPTSPLAESVRGLRTSLLFSNLDRPPRVVMLVSSVASEGKSTSSILLALMSAQMGKSAIVVDCDLRRPSLHTLLETEPGVSHSLPDVLAGSVTLDEAIEEDPETRLHFLAGRPGQQMSANAADILSSGRFHDVVAELRSAYDLVILDAPPVLSVTDARIIGNLADAVLYCVRWDHTTRGAVLEGLREFAMVGQKITGLVLTMVDQRKASSYGYSDCGYGTYKNRAADPYLDA